MSEKIEMLLVTPAEWLRTRAASYHRDAAIAKSSGDTDEWAIFLSVSDELNDAADMIDAGELTA